MFKIGQIFYFVSPNSTIIRPTVIRTIEIQPFTLDENRLGFSDQWDKENFVHITFLDTEIVIDPNVKYATEKGLNLMDISNRGYLIFSTLEKATDALINHIFPPMLEKQISVVTKKQDEYFDQLDKLHKLETLLVQLKGDDKV